MLHWKAVLKTNDNIAIAVPISSKRDVKTRQKRHIMPLGDFILNLGHWLFKKPTTQ